MQDNPASLDSKTGLASRLTRRSIFFIFSALLSVSVLAYLFTHISISEVSDLIFGSWPPAVLAFVVLSLSTSFFRMWRYRLMLSANGLKPAVFPLYLVVLVRNFCSDLLPARLGTLVYIFLAATRLGIPFSAATSSFALAFLFDILAIVPLIIAAIILAGAGTSLNATGLLIGSAVLCAITCGLIVGLPYAVRSTSALVSRFNILPSHLSAKFSALLAAVAQDISATRQAGLYGRLLVLSVTVRAGKYAALYMFLYALLAPQGYALADLPVGRVFLGLCAAELAASLPISGIAGIGAYQGAWVFTFHLLGFDLQIARLTSVAHHLFTQVYGYSLGILALLVLLLPAFERSAEERKEPGPMESPLRFAARLVCALLISGLLAALALNAAGA